MWTIHSLGRANKLSCGAHTWPECSLKKARIACSDTPWDLFCFHRQLLLPLQCAPGHCKAQCSSLAAPLSTGRYCPKGRKPCSNGYNSFPNFCTILPRPGSGLNLPQGPLWIRNFSSSFPSFLLQETQRLKSTLCKEGKEQSPERLKRESQTLCLPSHQPQALQRCT